MSRTLRAIMILFLVASCGMGGRSGPPPGNLDNACAILAERPQYKRAFHATERRWGVPVHVQMATIHQESKFDGNARTPFRYVLGVIPMGRQSSAYGYSQALDGTWDEYKRDTRRFSARRNDIDDATDFMGWYMAKSYERLGIPLHDARNQYLAYHEGRTGFSRGSYNAKPWLLRVSANVEERSRLYQAQLMSCNGRGFGVF
ncbi:transglycosylase SLT domain-containing protein [Roseovarius pacificus]|uniref:transglycosylase SLT domain-containing protein n=1 Tax=Roseovarius pacificus TaxID=337701 RepID=UPI004039E7FB